MTLTLPEWLARFADIRLDPAEVIRGNVRVREHRGALPVVEGSALRRLRVAPRIRRGDAA